MIDKRQLARLLSTVTEMNEQCPTATCEDPNDCRILDTNGDEHAHD
jgi:hypothetical protein